MALTDFVTVSFAALAILAAGMVVFYGLEREPENYYRLERLAYCWSLGMSVLGMPLFLLSWSGLRIQSQSSNGYWWRSSCCVWARDCCPARLTPMCDWDGICTWGIKAKVLFYGMLQSSVGYFRNAEYRCTNQADPLLWPLMYAWVCTVVGRWDDLAMCAVINPLNLAVFVGLLYFTLRKSNFRTVALLISALAASLPASMHYTECMQSDVPLMLISGAATFCLFDWMRQRRRGSILLAGVLMGGAMFTKEEGRLVLVAQCGAMGLYVLSQWASRERNRLLGHVVVFVLIAGLWFSPWWLFRRTIPVWTQYFGPIGLSTIKWGEIYNLWQIVLFNVLRFYNGAGLPKWNFLWPMLALFVLFSKAPRQKPWSFLVALFLLQAFG